MKHCSRLIRRHPMRRFSASIVLAVVLHAAAPSFARPSSAPARHSPPSLHDRIQRANNGETTFADPHEEFAAIEAMRAEVARGARIDLRDQLTLEKLRAVATAHNGDFPGATKTMAGVVARARAEGLAQDPLMVDLLENLGTIESLRGDPSSGLTHLQAAADILKRQPRPDLDELGAIEGNIGYAYLKLGRVIEAVRYVHKGVDGRTPGIDKRVAYLGNVDTLVTSHNRLGEYDEALHYARLGLERAAEWLPPNHIGFAYFNMNAASVYLDTGRLDEAEASYRLALGVLDAHPDANRTIAGIVVGKLADIVTARGRLADAEALARRSLETLKDVKTSEQTALGKGWVRLGRIMLARGDTAGALASAESAVAAFRERGDTASTVWQAYALMARAQVAQGDFAAAAVEVDRAQGLLESIVTPDAPERLDVESLRALILARLGRTDTAWQAAEPMLARLSARLADPRSSRRARLAVAPPLRQAFTRLADVAAATGHPDAAFRAAQLASFTEISSSSLALAARAASRDPATGEQARAVQDLQERIDHLGRERGFALGKSAEKVTNLDAEIKAAEAKLDQQLGALRQAFPAYDELTRPAPVTPDAARKVLRKDQALLLPVQSDDRLTTMVLTRAGLTTHSVPLRQTDSLRAVERLRAHLDGDAGGTIGFDRAAAWQLGGALFAGPVLKALGGIREIDMVGSGALMTLPPGLLLTAAPRGASQDLRALPFALRRFAFAVKPTVGARAATAPASTLAFLGVGAPMLGPVNEVLRGGSSLGILRGGIADAGSLRALPSLPRAGDELAAIAHALPATGNVLLTGAAASEAAVRAQPLAHFGLLAFATHGLVSGELRGLDEPALVLTPPNPEAKGSDDDGLLTASEIAGLSLDAEWVILSACNTGAGSENGAGGYSGLARGFMQAGARSLLVSLWPVRDDVAARLTVETVRGHVRGLSQAAALRKAALDLIADRTVAGSADPATWAPFSLVMQ